MEIIFHYFKVLVTNTLIEPANQETTADYELDVHTNSYYKHIRKERKKREREKGGMGKDFPTSSLFQT